MPSPHVAIVQLASQVGDRAHVVALFAERIVYSAVAARRHRAIDVAGRRFPAGVALLACEHVERAVSADRSVQLASQVADWPAVSHCSPAVTIPLPHAVTVQFESQPSPLTRLPSSQASDPVTHAVAAGRSTVQLESQPSPLIVLPSSQPRRARR